MKTQVILKYVGAALVTVSLLMAASGLVALYDAQDDSAMPLLFSAYITFSAGMFPMIFTRKSSEISNSEGYAIVAYSWIAVCIFGMLPYLCYSRDFTLADALFESVSGFTTTGASILDDIESLPKGLLFWRSASAWMGGFGIVTIFSLAVPRGHDIRAVLTSAEMSELAKSQIVRKGKSFILGMLVIYLSLTSACTLSLKLTGMAWFDAVTNAMSACSTCGFCIRNSSIAYYETPAVEYILCAYMILAAVSFVAFFSAFKNRSVKKFMKSDVLKYFMIVIAVSTILTTIDQARTNGINNLGTTFRTSLFQVCSIITTTGFSTADTNHWPALSIIIICLISLVCGCSGSTSGGIKMDRAVILAKDMIQNIRVIFSPHKVVSVKMDGRMTDEAKINETKTYVLLYLLILLAGALVNTFVGLDFETGASASMACLGNVGPGFGTVGSMGNYHSLPAISKYVCMLEMLAGRLEIIPLLFIFSKLRRKA